MRVIHLIRKPFKIGDEVRTRCGKSASVDSTGVGAARLIDAAGNEFFASTHIDAVTCKKCINLHTVGTIHDRGPKSPSRAANAAKRAPVPAA